MTRGMTGLLSWAECEGGGFYAAGFETSKVSSPSARRRLLNAVVAHLSVECGWPQPQRGRSAIRAVDLAAAAVKRVEDGPSLQVGQPGSAVRRGARYDDTHLKWAFSEARGRTSCSGG